MHAIEREFVRHLVAWMLISTSSGAALCLSSVPSFPLAQWLPDVARLLYGLIAIDIVLCGLRWRRCW